MAELPPLASGLVPVPDPTKLTTDAVNAASAQWRRELDYLRELIETRLSGMDEATRVRADAVEQIRAEIFQIRQRLREESAHESAALREIIETRLNGSDLALTLLAEQIKQLPIDAEMARDRLRNEMQAADQAERNILETRIAGMDEATKLLADNVSVIGDAIEKSAVGTKQIIETRLAGMDEATKLLATNVDKVPYAILQEAGNLRAFIMSKIDDVSHVSEERFKAVDALFASNALALTAALAAQEKAVAEQNKSNTLAITKSEVSTKETIAANAAQTSTGLAALATTIADLKDRVVRIEAGGIGAQGQRTETRLNMGQAIAVMGAILTAAAIIVTIILATGH